ncbi:hypothetical protein [Agromyces sp. NPDC056965]|uniref:hypothetical protein n=1 Tax=Agromyces sp. NPDC056965 TaxID=3345983 RepID=UPI00362CA946
MADYEDAKKIQETLSKANQNWGDGKLFAVTDIYLRGTVTSRIAYILDGRDIDYVTVDMTAGEDEFRILLFTEGLLFDVTYSKVQGVLITATPLSALERVRMVDGPDYLRSETEDVLARAVVTIDGEELLLPADGSTSANATKFHEFLPRLVERLADH